jgi:predicted outer membrane protein
LVPIVASAQQRDVDAGAQRNSPTARQSNPQTTGGNAREVATLLAIGNRGEIEIAQLAMQNAQDPKVKQFAQQMIKDHTDYLEKLNHFAGGEISQTGAQRPNTLGGQNDRERTTSNLNKQAANAQDNQNRTTADRSDRADSGRTHSGSQGGQVSVLDFEREIGEQRVQMTTEMLRKHDGTTFDHAYIGQQIVMHTEMLATLRGLRPMASEELGSTIYQGIQKTEQHLEMATQLMQQLPESPRGENRSP